MNRPTPNPQPQCGAKGLVSATVIVKGKIGVEDSQAVAVLPFGIWCVRL